MPLTITAAKRHIEGTTLMEVIFAAVIGTVVAAGTMTATFTSLRVSSSGTARFANASLPAGNVIEKVKSDIYCGGPLFDPSCGFTPHTWTNGPTQTSSVTLVDCNGSLPGDTTCIQVSTKVTFTPPE